MELTANSWVTKIATSLRNSIFVILMALTKKKIANWWTARTRNLRSASFNPEDATEVITEDQEDDDSEDASGDPTITDTDHSITPIITTVMVGTDGTNSDLIYIQGV